jgi:hypothetical protein
LGLFLFSIRPVYAAFSGISVSPSIIELDLQTQAPVATLTYTNNTREAVGISLSAQNFIGLSDTGQINYAGNTLENYRYGLSAWIQLDTNAITLMPGESKTVQISIEKEALPQGTHFASILAAVQVRNTAKSVTIQPVLSSLLFVRADSLYNREEANIISFDPDRLFPYFPSDFTLRINNSGNIALTPYGLVMVKDIFGRTVARGVVNTGSLIALPESIRRFDIPVSVLTGYLLPGFYSADLTVEYGLGNRLLVQTVTFFSQGSIDWVKICAGLLALLLIYYVYKKWKQ